MKKTITLRLNRQGDPAYPSGYKEIEITLSNQVEEMWWTLEPPRYSFLFEKEKGNEHAATD